MVNGSADSLSVVTFSFEHHRSVVHISIEIYCPERKELEVVVVHDFHMNILLSCQ